MYKYLLILLCIYRPFSPFAQHTHSLGPGEDIPQFPLFEVINYSKAYVNLSDFKGKAILLDFGATYCKPCITSLPKLDVLQNIFHDDLQVFMVTHEPKEKVTAFLRNNAKVKGVQVPVIVADTLLHQAFRHITQPHVVWIGKDRKVKALTGHHYIDSANIRALIENEVLDWPVKWDFPYDYDKPMVVFNPENTHIAMRPDRWQLSIISGHMKGVIWRQQTVVDTNTQQVRVSAFNIPILKMYLTLLGYIWEYNFKPSQVVLHNIDDPIEFFYSETFGKAEWDQFHTYCYEMVFPSDIPESRRNKMIVRQLDAYFGLTVKLKKMKRQCWVMTVSDKDLFTRKQLSVSKQGYSIRGLSNAINKKIGHPPLIDELRLNDAETKSVRLEVDAKTLDDFESLKKRLEPQGIGLEVQVREIETLWVERLVTP